MELKVLGCGDAFGNGGRFHTSFLVSSGDELILLDCGASTLIRLKQERVDLNKISTVILSHFHGDHFGGIPFLLISFLFESRRSLPLTIAGPPGVKDRVEKLLQVMYPGTLEDLDKLDIRFLEYGGDEPLHFDGKTLEAVPVQHSPPSIPYAVRLTWQKRVIAFSGDTSWTDHLFKISEGAHVFICECNFLSQRTAGHLCYEEIVEKAGMFTCKVLYLTHMSNEVLAANDLKFPRLSDGQVIQVGQL